LVLRPPASRLQDVFDQDEPVADVELIAA
jgi:hypothetical protein